MKVDSFIFVGAVYSCSGIRQLHYMRVGHMSSRVFASGKTRRDFGFFSRAYIPGSRALVVF